ncbi:hypothetical protein T484DRAFT_1920754, partial [Baffinella frigidus]
MARRPHRSAQGIMQPRSEVGPRARGCATRLRPLLFVLVFSMLAGRGGRARDSGSLEPGSSRLLSTHMNVHGSSQRQDAKSWDSGPLRGLEKGMVNVDGFEIPKHVTGWARVRAMSDSSWKRDAKTIEETWDIVGGNAHSDPRLDLLSIDLPQTREGKFLKAPESKERDPEWAPKRERLVVNTKQFDAVFSVYLSVLRDTSKFDALFSVYLSVLRDNSKAGRLKMSSSAWKEVEAQERAGFEEFFIPGDLSNIMANPSEGEDRYALLESDFAPSSNSTVCDECGDAMDSKDLATDSKDLAGDRQEPGGKEGGGGKGGGGGKAAKGGLAHRDAKDRACLACLPDAKDGACLACLALPCPPVVANFSSSRLWGAYIARFRSKQDEHPATLAAPEDERVREKVRISFLRMVLDLRHFAETAKEPSARLAKLPSDVKAELEARGLPRIPDEVQVAAAAEEAGLA